MDFLHDDYFARRANEYKKDLIHTKRKPISIVEMVENGECFQGLSANHCGVFSLPYSLSAGESVIVDFGEHLVGRLCCSLSHDEYQIVDSPAMLEFCFGEFPLEIVKSPDEYRGVLGSGWIQRETRSVAITPASISLDRRYSFRYLKISRRDTAKFPVIISDIYADCTSAVNLDALAPIAIADETLKMIYDASVRTLKECSQDVFEDGPKRDRRLWSGDLRLEALTDYVTFKNADLVKRCIYLFAAYRYKHGFVSQCIFSESYPYVYEHVFYDYSLFFISFLYDYSLRYDDKEFISELYPLALEQAELAFEKFKQGDIKRSNKCFIDWCDGLDKSVAMLGVLVYTLRQLLELAKTLSLETRTVEEKIAILSANLASYYDAQKGIFVAESGQISWHSQIWGVLANVLPAEQNAKIISEICTLDTKYYPKTPYMMHYYIEALFACGFKERAMETIKDYWGEMLDAGFDCCTEVFDTKNHFLSPYNSPELNSACHAWSCTPAYWIYRYYNE